MFLISLLLWIVGFIILISNPKNSSNRWAAFLAFCTGCGGVPIVLENAIIPYYTSLSGYLPILMDFLVLLTGLFASFSHYLAPYALLIFSFSYTGLLPWKFKKHKLILFYLLLIPIILMYLIYPLYPKFEPSYIAMTAWVFVYVMYANTLLVYQFLKTKNKTLKRQHLYIVLFVTPATLSAFLVSYLFSAFEINGLWNLNIIIIPVQIIIFVVLILKHQLLGGRLRFKKYGEAALDDLVDHITDSFVILNKNDQMIDINQSFKENFGELQQGKDFIKEIQKNSYLYPCREKLQEYLKQAKKSRSTVSCEEHIICNDVFDKYFNIEITPVYLEDTLNASIVLFKDITDYKRNLILIEQNQNQMIENERLLALSQLVGGIAHNLKTPIFSSSGGIRIISTLVNQSSEMIENLEIDPEIKNELMKNKFPEIQKWQSRIKDYLSYMNDVISTLKAQTTPAVEGPKHEFRIGEFIKTIKMLMSQELKKASCTIAYNIQVDESFMVEGEINYLVQVINNLISNAIDAYDHQGGEVFVSFEKKNSGKLDIIVTDYGKGIPLDIQQNLFKKMVTTKGKEGSGLGLYISKSIIASKFGGEITFESAEGKGSKFTITIPVRGGYNEQ